MAMTLQENVWKLQKKSAFHTGGTAQLGSFQVAVSGDVECLKTVLPNALVEG